MNIGDVLMYGKSTLAESGIDEADLNAEYLLAHALSVERMYLMGRRTEPVGDPEMHTYRNLIARRVGHEPLQYILGTVNFMGLTLGVDQRVLIPRPETEILVEEALDALRSFGNAAPRVLDIGTGSGNIALAIASYAPQAKVTAMDCSQNVLDAAAANAESLGLTDIRFVQGDVFGDFLPGERFDLIVSNPPYVPLKEFEELQPEIRLYEPRLATTDESDGLRIIRRIIDTAPDRITPGGTLLLELGFDQSAKASLLAERAGLSNVAIRQDLNGIPRIMIATLQKR